MQPVERRTVAAPAAPAPSGGDAAGGGGPARSLAGKLFRRTLPVVVLVLLLIQGGIAWITWTDQRNALTHRAQIMAELTARAIATPIWYLDRTVFEPQVQALATDDGFRYARVFDELGKVLFQTGDAAALNATDTIVVSRDIMEPKADLTVGRIELVIGTDELNRTAALLAMTALLAVLVLAAALSITVQIVMRRLVVKPLARMLAAMRQVERKSWVQLDDVGDDELGQAGAAFNRMVDGLRSGDDAKRLLAALQRAQSELVDKNQALEAANHQVMESIRYARRIQEGILPDATVLAPVMTEMAVLWEPLDLVGGDYCWMERRDGQALVLVADCTGHGVPGAFMTMVVASALRRILDRPIFPQPDVILTELDRIVRHRLRQDAPDLTTAADDGRAPWDMSDDGLDAGVCIYDEATGLLYFAGAGLSLTVIGPDGVMSHTGVRRSLGYRTLPPPGSVPVHCHQVLPGERFYLWTDGVSDHVGGQPKRVFGRRRVAATLARLAHLSLDDQIQGLCADLDRYRGAEARRDDMTMVAFQPRLPDDVHSRAGTSPDAVTA